MRAATLCLAAVQIAFGLLSGAYLPFFSASLAARGLSAATIGTALAAATLLRIAIAPFVGIAADAHGDRRLVLLAFAIPTLIAFVFLSLVHDAGAIILWSIAGIVLWSSMSPILESVTLRAAENTGTAYGAVRVWLSIAFVIANVGSGFAASRFGLEIIAPWLAACAGLQLCAIYALNRTVASKPTGSFGFHFRSTFAEARELLTRPVFILFLTICSLIQGSHVLYYTYAGLIWREHGMAASVIGLIWPLGVLAEIVLFFFSARIVRRVDPVHLMAIGAVACAVRWTIMAFDPGLPLLLFAQILHGLTFAVPHLGAMYFILHGTPPRLSATAQSLYSVSIGIVSSTLLIPAGHFYAAWGGKIFLLMSAMSVIAVFLTIVLRKSRASTGNNMALLADDLG